MTDAPHPTPPTSSVANGIPGTRGGGLYASRWAPSPRPNLPPTPVRQNLASVATAVVQREALSELNKPSINSRGLPRASLGSHRERRLPSSAVAGVLGNSANSSIVASQRRGNRPDHRAAGRGGARTGGGGSGFGRDQAAAERSFHPHALARRTRELLHVNLQSPAVANSAARTVAKSEAWALTQNVDQGATQAAGSATPGMVPPPSQAEIQASHQADRYQQMHSTSLNSQHGVAAEDLCENVDMDDEEDDFVMVEKEEEIEQ